MSSLCFTCYQPQQTMSSMDATSIDTANSMDARSIDFAKSASIDMMALNNKV